ncbi:MAG: methionyl-tRNA formyltransferase [Burkholderiales bacterium]
MPALRVGFAGTPPFAAEALSAIAAAGFAVPVVLTQPDRPSGRGMKLAPSAVKEKAQALGIPVLQPPTLKTEDARAPALAVPLDVLVVAAYGLILPPAVLAWPRHGCINIHASRLPRWRGAAPIQRALLAGDEATGVTIMQMDAGLDTGPMIDVTGVPIAPRETTGTLTSKLAAAGAAGVVAVLERLARDGRLEAQAQPADGVTYASKIERADAVIDWTQPAAVLDRVVRAFDPAPGASTHLGGEALKLWDAVVLPAGGGAPGTVLAVGNDGIDVACGSGALRLRTVQPAGGKRMPAAAFARGRDVTPGARLGS